jgi:hypothetical protein
MRMPTAERENEKCTEILQKEFIDACMQNIIGSDGNMKGRFSFQRA